jgi:hypothetical protein
MNRSYNCICYFLNCMSRSYNCICHFLNCMNGSYNCICHFLNCISPSFNCIEPSTNRMHLKYGCMDIYYGCNPSQYSWKRNIYNRILGFFYPFLIYINVIQSNTVLKISRLASFFRLKNVLTKHDF